MIKYIAFVVFIAIISGFSYSKFAISTHKTPKTYEERIEAIEGLKKEFANKFTGVKNISVKDAKKLVDQENTLIVDIRESKERSVSRIKNSISRKEFLANIEKHKDKTIIAYCTIGYRSSKFIMNLPDDMKDNSYNLEGSILSWINEGEKLYTESGNETNKVHVYGNKWNVLPPNYQAITD